MHNLTEQDGYLLLSCGEEGLYALDGDLRPAFHWKTEDAAHYLTGMNGLLFVAEGDRGVGCYRFTPQAGFAPVGRLPCEGRPGRSSR